MNQKPDPLSRRALFAHAGALGLAALAPGRLLSAALASPSRSLVLPQGGGCVLAPALTEGPYYINPALVRPDVTEGLPGYPMQLNLRVARVAGCAPVSGAIVDIWHCDAGGLYSGYTGQLGNVSTVGQNFYRGVQLTDASGVATFHTNYPGWYPGRAVHIHFKVILSATTAVTSQLYVPDTLTDDVFAACEPYTARGTRPTRNTNDGLYRPQLLMNPAVQRGGVVVDFTIGIA
jgi:protocatechuate 3,4-dioxygenase beta subunit